MRAEAELKGMRLRRRGRIPLPYADNPSFSPISNNTFTKERFGELLTCEKRRMRDEEEDASSLLKTRRESRALEFVFSRHRKGLSRGLRSLQPLEENDFEKDIKRIEATPYRSHQLSHTQTHFL